ncbi:hypothetical protein TNCV_3747281 [Trichonephila clavipes]|nr:hypothetical protein TNCV_3747281 [Trichonephila clavipes]
MAVSPQIQPGTSKDFLRPWTSIQKHENPVNGTVVAHVGTPVTWGLRIIDTVVVAPLCMTYNRTNLGANRLSTNCHFSSKMSDDGVWEKLRENLKSESRFSFPILRRTWCPLFSASAPVSTCSEGGGSSIVRQSYWSPISGSCSPPRKTPRVPFAHSKNFKIARLKIRRRLRFRAPGLLRTATAGSDVVQSGRPIFDDFFQHLWPYIGNNTANIVFQMVKRLWLIRIDQ